MQIKNLNYRKKALGISSAARIRPKRPWPPETNLLRFFAGALYQLQLFDADWWRCLTSYPVIIDQKLSRDIKMIFVQNSYRLNSDDVSDWPLPNKIIGCAHVGKTFLFDFRSRFCSRLQNIS